MFMFHHGFSTGLFFHRFPQGLQGRHAKPLRTKIREETVSRTADLILKMKKIQPARIFQPARIVITGRWFQICFIFIPIWGNDPI